MGYWLAFTLPTIVFLISPLFLWFGHGRYRVSPPTGSVLGASFRLWRYASSGRWSLNPVRCIRQLTADDFWENAKPSNVLGEKPKWMQFDDNWVDEVRRGFKACSVFAWFPIYCTWIPYVVHIAVTFFVSRALLQSTEQQSDLASCHHEHPWPAE